MGQEDDENTKFDPEKAWWDESLQGDQQGARDCNKDWDNGMKMLKAFAERLGVSSLSEFERKYSRFDALSSASFNAALEDRNEKDETREKNEGGSLASSKRQLLNLLQLLRDKKKSKVTAPLVQSAKRTCIGEKFDEYEDFFHTDSVEKTPPLVEVNCKILGVYEICEGKQTFNVNFEVEFQWTDPSIPHSSGGKYPDDATPKWEDHFKPCIQLLQISDSSSGLVLEEPQLIDRYAGRCSMKGEFSGSIIQTLDMREYPFDIQHLHINVSLGVGGGNGGVDDGKRISQRAGHCAHIKLVHILMFAFTVQNDADDGSGRG
jgi:hypothetical protein